MRGRGRGGRGFRDDSGVPRTGPVTEEAATFPPNPALDCRTTSLDDHQQKLVALNRILINYWTYQSPFQVQDQPEVLGVKTYSAGLKLAAATDPSKQKDLIVSFTGPQYFPSELLADKFVPLRTKRAIAKIKRTTNAAEGDAVDAGTANAANDEEDAEPEAEDFGGDDYAHDHYADEDKDDFDEGGGDEEMF